MLNRKSFAWLSAFAGAILFLPRDAMAHAGLVGIGDFWNGVLHLALDIKQGLAVLALGLCLARAKTQQRESPFGVFHLAFAAGLIAGLALFPPATGYLGALPLAICGLLLLDPAGWVSKHPAIAIGAASFATGLAFAADTPAEVVGFVFAAGIFIGAVLIPVYAAAIWERFQRPWFYLATRILGSWLAAIAIMLFGLSFRGTP